MQQIMCQRRQRGGQEKGLNPFTRSPTLSTILMVEGVIEKNSGKYNRTKLWKNLPKKVMWQTFLVILDYLESTNKIAIDRERHIAYIWNPISAKSYLKERNLAIKSTKESLSTN